MDLRFVGTPSQDRSPFVTSKNSVRLFPVNVTTLTPKKVWDMRIFIHSGWEKGWDGRFAAQAEAVRGEIL